MSITTKIQWCDSTCNPTMGCEGCELWTTKVKRCYAGTLHSRFGGHTRGYSPTFEEVTFWPGRMSEAARWADLKGAARKDKPWLDGLPRMIFVSDMSDSLSAAVSFEFLEEEIIRNVISPNGQRHRWLWLTKRPDRMAQFSRWLAKRKIHWPENLWAGTSITTQATTSRIKRLLEVGNGSTIRFLSVEPQYERIDLTGWLPKLDWIIQGGESGSGAHPFDIQWAYDLKQQCFRLRVPYFLKQLGSCVFAHGEQIPFADSHAGEWSAWPKALRVRQIAEQDIERASGEPPSAMTDKYDLSEVAKRAWATRKANEAKRKRTDAAHKAWEARRAKELQKKRTEAVRKAWRTRKGGTDLEDS
ncbi:MAG: DUF5131 family protein [Pirellulaceae bacterium]